MHRYSDLLLHADSENPICHRIVWGALINKARAGRKFN